MSIDGGHLQCCYDSKLCVSLLYPLTKKVLHFIVLLSYIYTNTYNTECKKAETPKDTNISGKHIPFVSGFILDT